MNRETTFWTIVATLALAVILVLYAQDAGLFEQEEAPAVPTGETTSTGENLASTADSPDSLSLECLDHGELSSESRHDHVTLQIFIDDTPYTVESSTGVQTDVCNGNENNMHVIHTHDASGRLHIEVNEAGDVPLGVFFDIWGQHFNETGIFDYRVNSTHEMVMHVHASGESATVENRVTTFDDYLLQNGEVIEIHYRAKSN
ncbi:MAG: hypothetical protein OSA21_06230 [Candidatus Poseidoniaceae archaeon]|nr:hypothetical protein [Candidatus Poseidoniaceae archaeon]